MNPAPFAFLGLSSAVAVALVLGAPFAGAILAGLAPGWKWGARVNVASSACALLGALTLAQGPTFAGAYLFLDPFNALLVLVSTFVGLTTSLYSYFYARDEIAAGRWPKHFHRFYHAGFQALLGFMSLALLAHNIGLMWVAIELATLTCVAAVGAYRTPHALEAAWKYFMLGSVGVALALFGTVLVYVAAQPVLGEGAQAMVFANLLRAAPDCAPGLLNVAFVFLMLGYGVKLGLFPMHAWLPDAHAEGPTPIAAVLSGLLLNVALHAIVRFKLVLSANGAALRIGPLLAVFGLLTLLYAAFMLYRRNDLKRLFGYSSLEHMGLATIAFALGGPIAPFAGLLHLVHHALCKSATFFVVGRLGQARGGQTISDLRGLTQSRPAMGWMLLACFAAVAGLPPFGLMTSEFLLVIVSFARAPLVAGLIVVGLLIAFIALLRHGAHIGFGPPAGVAEAAPAQRDPALWLAGVHLALSFALALFMPRALGEWLRVIAAMLE